MLRIGISYVSTLVIFLAMDATWLGVVAGKLYRQTLGDILLDRFRAGPAIVFYLLYIAGLMVFAIPRAGTGEGWKHALLYGALFGVFTYATYDLTNYATLKAWTLGLTLSDVAWGAFVSGVGSALGLVVGNWVLSVMGRA